MARGAAALAVLALAASALHAAEDDWDELFEDDWEEETGALVWTGFAELAGGVRLDGNDPHRATLGELRGRAETAWTGERLTASFKGDAAYDDVLNEAGVGVRELAVQVPGHLAALQVDVKAGRQVLTWGTGDLVFLNDLFPKDFESFFAGRDDEYLKAPSNALRVTAYHHWLNADLVWTPEFAPDVYLDGERFTFFHPATGDIDVWDPPLSADRPQGLDSGELALRLFKRREATEYALYAYRGYFKQPTAVNENGRPTFAPLTAYGASVRTTLGRGLVNGEVAYYHSRDDTGGDDPRTPNSQARWLVGYERELVTNLTGAVQYYGERLDDYDALRTTAPDRATMPDKWRSLITTRLTYRAMRDNLTLGLFTFYSPSDQDWHLRPSVGYRLSDAWQITGGANLFGGDEPHTFFGQLEDNGNVFLRVRRYY